MNKTLITICFFVLVALGITGGTLILLLRPDASATFIQLCVVILGLGTTAVITFAGIDKVQKKVDNVETNSKVIAENVNGNIKRLIQALETVSKREGSQPLHEVIDPATIDRIRKNGDDMQRLVESSNDTI